MNVASANLGSAINAARGFPRMLQRRVNTPSPLPTADRGTGVYGAADDGVRSTAARGAGARGTIDERFRPIAYRGASSAPETRVPGRPVSSASRLRASAPRPDRPTAQAAPADAVDASDAGQFAPMINAAAKRYGVDPTLVAAVARAESSFNPRAISEAGAKGLMQLMDATARQLGVADSFDPEQNVDGGTKFLGEMMRRFGKPELALAAYNAGPGAVSKHGGIPPYRETQTYVKRVLDFQRQMRAS